MSKTVAVIGLGSIGMRHAKNLRELGHHVWGYDPDMKRRLELGFDYTVGKLEHLAAADAFVVASPTIEHNNHIVLMRMMAAKPVFVEKPIGHLPLERILIDQVQMVGYNQRFNSAVKQAKEWLDAGEIGDPLWAHFQCSQFNNKPAYLRDGVILNWSHEIDLALYLLGDAKVEASKTIILGGGQDVMTDIILQHKICTSTVHLDYLTKPERRGFSIGGTKGNISIDLPRRTAEMRKVGEPLTHIEFVGSYDQDYKDEMHAFVDRIDGKETIGCTGAEALKVLEICLTVRKQAGLE